MFVCSISCSLEMINGIFDYLFVMCLFLFLAYICAVGVGWWVVCIMRK